MSDDLLQRLDEWGTVKRLEYLPSLGREAAARVRELDAERDALRADLAYRLREAEGFAATLKEVNRIAQAWKQALIAAEAERDALLRDAERYRWLRDRHEYNIAASEIVQEVSGEGWDAAIDAALGSAHD